MVIAHYFESIEHLLSNSKLITDKKIDFKEFGNEEGMVTGRLLFLGGYTLSFMEYVLIGQQRPKYRFNLSDSKGKLIIRSIMHLTIKKSLPSPTINIWVHKSNLLKRSDLKK